MRYHNVYTFLTLAAACVLPLQGIPSLQTILVRFRIVLLSIPPFYPFWSSSIYKREKRDSNRPQQATRWSESSPGTWISWAIQEERHRRPEGKGHTPAQPPKVLLSCTASGPHLSRDSLFPGQTTSPTLITILKPLD